MINQLNSQQALCPAMPEAAPVPFSLIGDLAQRAGVSPMTIRFYEREGLLSPNRVGRFRTYGSADERRLALILRLRRIGVPIAKVRTSLRVFEDPASPQNHQACAKLLAEHLAELSRKHKEIACQIASTADYLKELGVAVDGAMAGPESNGPAATEGFEEGSAPLEE